MTITGCTRVRVRVSDFLKISHRLPIRHPRHLSINDNNKYFIIIIISILFIIISILTPMYSAIGSHEK